MTERATRPAPSRLSALLDGMGLGGMGGQRLPTLILSLVLLLSLLGALVTAGLVREQQRSRFEREVQAYTAALTNRLNDYDRLLEIMRVNWQVSGAPLSQAQFSSFAQQVHLEDRYPGIETLGYARLTTPPGGAPAAPVTLIAPLSADNRVVLGFDLYREPRRRAALVAALAGGRAQASLPVTLLNRVSPDDHPPGFLLIVPLRSGGGTGAPDGVLYTAVNNAALIRSLALPDPETQGRLSVEARLAGMPLNATTPPSSVVFDEVRRTELLGQPWELHFRADGAFGQDFAANIPTLILVLGLLVSGLAFLIVQAQTNARRRAEALNDSLAEARAEQGRVGAQFRAIFQSMQDAAAFTDTGGRVRLVNRALERQFGLREAELVGQSLARLHGDERLGEQTTFRALTTPYLRADGSRFSGEAQRSEVQDEQGERLGLLEVVRDVSDRVAAERAVQGAERRSRAVLDAVPHLIQVVQPGGAVRSVNAQHLRLLGDRPLAEHLSGAGLERYERLWHEAQASGQGGQVDVPLALEGGPRWYTVTVSPIRDAEGQVTEWVTSATDIHDRLNAERLAQRNEERSRSVLEGLPQIVWLTDPTGQAQTFNRRWAEYTGVRAQAEGAGGQTFLSRVHPEDRPAYQARWAQALRSGRPFEAEHRLLSAQGAYRTFVTRGVPLLDAGAGGGGQVAEWVGTSTDVDDSVYAENAARLQADVAEQLARRGETRERRAGHYRAALARITERFVDSGSLWIAGPPAAQVTSSLHPGWNAPHMRLAVEQVLRQVAATHDPLFVTSHPLLHGVDTSGAVLYPLQDRAGHILGILGLSYRHALSDRDYDLAQELARRFAAALENDALQHLVDAAQADLKALNLDLEERVQRRTLELEGANRELEAFSYSVSHDLRTPLRHIVGFGDLLGKEAGAVLSAKGQRYLGVMTDSAARMSRLIDDLLDFSRMGRQELRRAPVDLGSLVGDTWAGLEPDRQGRDVRLSVQPGLPTVSGDPAMLALVFMNLLGNAIKYSRGQGTAQVDVSWEARGEEVSVSVRDNGVGFDPRYADKLFGVFQRLHRADEFEGIGIGLANVRRIVGRHGGRVEAASQPGEGATFTVTLPVAAPAEVGA